jgi:hypothetical protein
VVTIRNQDVVKTLEEHFKTLSDVICNESKATPNFALGSGYVDNLLYDKTKCNKSEFRRKIGELFGGVCMMPIVITLKEDVLRQKLEEFDRNPASPQSAVSHDQKVDRDSLEKKNEPALDDHHEGGVINLEKPQEGGAINLDKGMESGGISLDKPHDNGNEGSGISLDKAPQGGISLDKPHNENDNGAFINLDKPSEDGGISLDKAPQGGISLDKPQNNDNGAFINLDKPREEIHDGISLDKAPAADLIVLEKVSHEELGNNHDAISLDKPSGISLDKNEGQSPISLGKLNDDGFVEIDLTKPISLDKD